MKVMVKTSVTRPAKVEAMLSELHRNGGYWTKIIYGSKKFEAWQETKEALDSGPEVKE